jgi:4'-phosphopantetheinyl transferase EntD
VKNLERAQSLVEAATGSAHHEAAIRLAVQAAAHALIAIGIELEFINSREDMRDAQQ